MAGSRLRASLASSLHGSSTLATNGGALVLNVVVLGAGGLVFWITAARVASPAAVAQASALVGAMLGLLVISQQTIALNLPMLVAASPAPGRVLARAYVWGMAGTTVAAVAFVTIGPRVADGLRYLDDVWHALGFVVGCVVWTVFSLQDAALSGVHKGHVVLAESTVWSALRLALLLALAWSVDSVGPMSILGTWWLPALVMVVAVNTYMYVGRAAPLRRSRGELRFTRRQLISHLGFEQLTAMGSGVVNIVLPAAALTAIGDARSAPFFAAYALIVVVENAIGSFAGAFGVEVRRIGGIEAAAARLTFGVLGALSIAAILSTLVLAAPLMGMFGQEYRGPGGDALLILVLGLPFRSVALISAATHRALGQGWRNFVQQLAYVAVTFLGLAIVDVRSPATLAMVLVAGRAAAAVIALWHLNSTRLEQRARKPFGTSDATAAAGIDA